MSKTCPNCLHPVRSGANYCGYCGTSLVPTPRDPSPGSRTSARGSAAIMVDTSMRHTPKSQKSGRAWIKVPIILLALVILLALTVRFWPEILIYLGQVLPTIRLS